MLSRILFVECSNILYSDYFVYSHILHFGRLNFCIYGFHFPGSFQDHSESKRIVYREIIVENVRECGGNFENTERNLRDINQSSNLHRSAVLSW